MPTPAEIQSRYDIRLHSAVEKDDIWEIDSDQGLLELRVFIPDDSTSLSRWISLLDFLQENRFPAPRLIETVDGDALSEWQDGSGVLTSTVSGDSPSYEPGFFYGLGAAVGRLHSLDATAADLPEAGYNVRTERSRFIEQDGDPAIRAWEGYDSTRAELIEAWDRMPDFDDHPKVLINTGVFEWGAVLTGEGVALKNWREAGKGPAVVDIGPLFAFQGLLPDPDAPLRPSVAGAFLEGYRSRRQLTPLELEQLPDAIAFGVLTYAIERWREQIEEVTWWRVSYLLDHRAQIVRQLKRFLDAASHWIQRHKALTSVPSPPAVTHPSTGPSPDEFEADYGFNPDRFARLSGRAWQVVSGDRQWVLRLHDPELQVYHPGEIATLRFLESVNFPAPRLLPTRTGDVLIRRGNDAGYTVSYVEGEPIDRNLDAVHEIGYLIASLHSLNVTDKAIPESQHSVGPRREQFKRNETDPEVRAWEGFDAIHRDLSAAWEQLSDFKDLPRVIVHSDLLYHNVIRTPEGTLALIDWDGAGIGSAVQDIGYFFKTYAVSPDKDGLRTEIATAFLSGYNQIRTLSPSEWNAIPDAMIYGSIFTVLWYDRVYERAWFRTRLILDHRHVIAEKLSTIRESL